MATFQGGKKTPKSPEMGKQVPVRRLKPYVAHGEHMESSTKIPADPADIDEFRSLSLTEDNFLTPRLSSSFVAPKTFALAVEKKLVEMLLVMKPSTRKRGTLEISTCTR